MLPFLFRRLTAEPERGAELFAALTAEARLPHWYVEGAVPDTLDGRFAMLATVVAQALVRLEQLGGEGEALSIGLTERFIEVMESEHRELGIGDPKLGRTVRKLVGSLARRTDSLRDSVDWRQTVHASVYKAEVSPHALTHTAQALRDLQATLQAATAAALAEGRFE